MRPYVCLLAIMAASMVTLGAVEGAEILPFQHPDAVATEPRSINNNGNIVGSFQDSSGFFYGYFLDRVGGTFTTIDIPGAGNTFVFGINNVGQMVGSFGDSLSGVTQGFLLNGLGDTPAIFSFPGAFATQAFAGDRLPIYQGSLSRCLPS